MTRAKNRGFTLIELTVVIAVSGVLMIALIGLFQILLRVDRNTREDLAEDRTLGRLSTMFRRDVREAERAEVHKPAEGPAQLELTSGERRVVYVFDSNLRRTVTEAKQAEAKPSPTSTENFRAIRLTGVQFEVDPAGVEGSTRFVRLRVDRAPLRPEGPTESLELTAPLSRDLRFAAKETP